MRRGVLGLGVIAIAIVVWLLWPHDSTQFSSSSSIASAASSQSFAIPEGVLARWKWLARGSLHRVAGRVVMNDLPVANATVRLVGTLSVAGVTAAPHVITDAAGHFDLGAQLATSYVISAEARHLTGALAELDLNAFAADDLVLVLHACDASLHGSIRDNGGGVIAGAVVARMTPWTVEAGDKLTGIAAIAGDDGTYELCVAPGELAVHVGASGYADAKVNVAAYGPVSRDFTLVPEATISGRVVLASDRSPVASALVEIDGHTIAATDASGHFTAQRLATGRIELSATAFGLATEHSVYTVAAIPAREDVEIALVPSHSISGHLVEVDTKKPVAGVSFYMFSIGSVLTATTQSDGSFRFEHALEGRYSPISHSMTDLRFRVTSQTVVADKDVENVELEIEQTASISGRVTFHGKPVDDAVVGLATHTDHDGRYVLSNLRPGEHWVDVESKTARAFSKSRSVTLAKGEHKTGVDIDLDLAASVSGVVIDQNGAPVKSARVDFSKLHGSDFGTGTTADDGTFAVGAMSGGGEYIYQVSSAVGPYRPAVGTRFPAIALRDNAVVTGLGLIVKRDELDIAGRVVDAEGQSLADLTVTAKTSKSQIATSASTDAAGAFVLHDLPSGTYELSTTALGDSDHPVVAAGRHDVVIHAAKTAAIEGTLVGFGHVREVIANDFPATIADSRTKFRVRDIPPGTYTVVVKDDDQHGSTTVTVAAGAVASVTIRALGFGDVVGTVVDDATSAPAAGITCSADAARDEVKTDGLGNLRLVHLAAEATRVSCYDDARFGTARTTVVENQQTHFELRVRPRGATVRQTPVGMQLESQFDDVVVVALVLDGLAARAGLLVGDTIDTIDGVAPQDFYAALRQIERTPVGSSVHLAISRGDDKLAIDLTIN